MFYLVRNRTSFASVLLFPGYEFRFAVFSHSMQQEGAACVSAGRAQNLRFARGSWQGIGGCREIAKSGYDSGDLRSGIGGYHLFRQCRGRQSLA